MLGLCGLSGLGVWIDLGLGVLVRGGFGAVACLDLVMILVFCWVCGFWGFDLWLGLRGVVLWFWV